MNEILKDVDVHIYAWAYAVTVNAVSLLLVGIPLFAVYRLVPGVPGQRFWSNSAWV